MTIMNFETGASALLVIRMSHAVEWDKIENLRVKIQAQLDDDPRFIVVPSHVDVHYMLPGDSLKGEEKRPCCR